jgi:hypothetical protein
MITTQGTSIADRKTDVERELDEASSPFVGRWNKLVTTTNWEKGRIIQQWREAMMASGAPVTEYSDEAWARRVTGVTGQHIGRLRRVYQQFGASYESYEGLYWSHFQIALDWSDGEEWLSQAAAKKWSVAQMRNARWDRLGVSPEQRVKEVASDETEVDEDSEPMTRDRAAPEALTPVREQARNAEGPYIEGPDFGDEENSFDEPPSDSDAVAPPSEQNELPAEQVVRPFERIGSLPDDVIEAFEAYKLVILRHKREHWRDISLDEMVGTLDSLKELAMAPTGEPAPF